MAQPYQTYLAVTSVVDLDIAQILPLNCMSRSPMNHLDVLLMIPKWNQQRYTEITMSSIVTWIKERQPRKQLQQQKRSCSR